MPYFTPPNSDADRLAFLKHTLTSSRNRRAAAKAELSLDTETGLAAFVPQFESAVDAVTSTQSARIRETRQRREALEKLSMYVRDLWAVLRRRVRRLGEAPEVHTYYRLPLDGTTLKPTRQLDWLVIAADVVRGDADAVAAGYPPMANPSAAEVAAVLAAAQIEAGEADSADRKLDQAQEAIALLRGEADQWVRDIMAELRFVLRRKSSASQRRIMRTYGATFGYFSGEKIDPDDQGILEEAVDR